MWSVWLAWLLAQRRRRALEQESQLQREAAEESRLKEDIRRVTQRVAEGRHGGSHRSRRQC